MNSEGAFLENPHQQEASWLASKFDLERLGTPNVCESRSPQLFLLQQKTIYYEDMEKKHFITLRNRPEPQEQHDDLERPSHHHQDEY